MLPFDDLFSRADETVLQQLLLPSAGRLIALLDQKYTTPSRLRPLIVELHTRAGMLLRAEYRKALLELLRPSEAAQLAGILGMPANSEPYRYLLSVSISPGTARAAQLFAFFEIAEPVAVLVDTIPTVEEVLPEYSLFVHQRKAVRSVQLALDALPNRVLLHMPTGAGKTRTAMNVIAEHLRVREPRLVLWLAYSEELCEQALHEFTRAWRVLGNRGITAHRFWGDHELVLDSAKDGIVIGGLPKLVATGNRDISVISTLAGRASLIVIDEAHQAIAPTYRTILDALFYIGAPSALLGLTATPGRTWSDVEADTQLSSYFGRRKVTLTVDGYANPVNYLIDEGYLARPSFRSLLHNSGKTLSRTDMEKVEAAFDIPSDILDKIADDEMRNLVILSEASRLLSRHERVLLFAASVRHAELLAAVLKAQGYAAASITGGTPPTERARLLAEYKNRDDTPRILCNFGILTTGFDAPQTSAVIIARPTKSLILYSQMVGRAIRGPKAGGNIEAEIVTMTDTRLPGFGELADAFVNWEDVWRNP